MPNDAMSRRRMLVGAGGAAAAVGAALAATASPAAAQGLSGADGRDHDGLVGTWLLTHTDDPGTPESDTGLATVSLVPGGVVINHEINPPGPPGQGAWERTGYGGFVLTFITAGQAPPEPGSQGPPLVFVVTVSATGTLSDGQISGKYTFSVADGDGNALDSGTGTFTGTRMSATG